MAFQFADSARGGNLEPLGFVRPAVFAADRSHDDAASTGERDPGKMGRQVPHHLAAVADACPHTTRKAATTRFEQKQRGGRQGNVWRSRSHGKFVAAKLISRFW